MILWIGEKGNLKTKIERGNSKVVKLKETKFQEWRFTKVPIF